MSTKSSVGRFARVVSLLCALLLLLPLSACRLSFLFPAESGLTAEQILAINEQEKQSHALDDVTDGYETVFRERFYYQLTPNERAVYDAILENGPSLMEVALPEPVFVATAPGEEPSEEETERFSRILNTTLKNALCALWLDDASYLWGEIGCEGETYSYRMRRTQGGNIEITALSFKPLSKEGFLGVENEAWEELLLAACAVEIEGETIEARARAINRILMTLADYDDGTGAYPHSALGVFRDGSVVCEGFARAFQLLCALNDVPCICVIGTGVSAGESGGHMWNYVQLDDGLWYAVDVTWNDGTDSEDYLFCGSTTENLHMSFDRSHLIETQISREGRNFAFPALSLTAYGYEPGAPDGDGDDFDRPFMPFFVGASAY